MTNKVIAIQGDHPSSLNPKTDTSIFLAKEIQRKKYKINISKKNSFSNIALHLKKMFLEQHI